MAYTKLANSILTSTIWMEDDKTRIVWMTLLAMSDQNGEVQASIPGLAHIARVSTESCREAIEKFLSPDPDSRTKDDEGRRIEEIRGGWLLINHGHYRDLSSNEDHKRKAAERQQRWRDKMKRNAPVTDRNAPVTQSNTASRPIPHTDTEADTESSGDAGASLASVATETPRKRSPRTVPPFEDVRLTFVQMFDRAAEWTDGRRKQLNARWRDPSWRDRWRDAMIRASESRFANGGGSTGWVMDLEFFLRPDTVTKILEGKYDDRESAQKRFGHAAAEREAANADAFAILGAAVAAARSSQGILGPEQPAPTTVCIEESGTVHAVRSGDVGCNAERLPY